MMGAMGYDATSFGNHEYDYLSSGLTSMPRMIMVVMTQIMHLLPNLHPSLRMMTNLLKLHP